MPFTLQTRRGFLGLSLPGIGLAWAARAQQAYGPGASDTEIRIGQTMAYCGPLSAYGALGKVEAAYFRKINDQGGVRGRKINFISLDDGYNPAKTVEGVRRLVEQDEVLLLAGSLGTPTNLAVKAYLHARGVPLLFLSTGGSMWNNPQVEPWVMGWAPNYFSEGRIYAQHILATKPNARIAVLYQNDDTGKDYLSGFKDGLADKAKGLISTIYLKDVTDPQLADDPAVKEWVAFMKKYYPSGNLLNSVNATGHSMAQTVVQVLMQCGDNLSRENVMRQAASLRDLELGLLMPGVKINTSPSDHAPIESLRMRRFDGKQWIAFGDVMGR